MIDYLPNPIDVSDVALPDGLNELTEEVARNVHEVWASRRIEEGWKYAKERDTTAKTTPRLVPYEELPENEKEYDRNTALSTLKLIEKLGYKIVPSYF